MYEVLAEHQFCTQTQIRASVWIHVFIIKINCYFRHQLYLAYNIDLE